jgi:hypothetical protein
MILSIIPNHTERLQVTDRELHEFMRDLMRGNLPNDVVVDADHPIDCSTLIKLLKELLQFRMEANRRPTNHSILSMVERYLAGNNRGTELSFLVTKNESGHDRLVIKATRWFPDGQPAMWGSGVDMLTLERMPREAAEQSIADMVHLAEYKIHAVGRGGE